MSKNGWPRPTDNTRSCPALPATRSELMTDLGLGKLAADLGSAPRAVGQACGANPFPLIVPCHRVTSAAGLGGFANAREGWLLEVKRWLLAFEGAL